MAAGIGLNKAIDHHCGDDLAWDGGVLPIRLLATQNNSMRSLTLSAAAASAGMLSFAMSPP
jgi:hypothetical protein